MIDELLKILDERIERKLARMNTAALGVVTQVDLQKFRCNVKLKNKVHGKEVELFEVPIAVQKFGSGSVIVAPSEGDVVVIIFSKHELEEQLKNNEIVQVNEILRFGINNAIVIAGIHTLVDPIPQINQDEILIQHKSGNYIKFQQDGRVVIKGDVYIDGDLDFKTIRGTNADDGTWHNPP
ncbi:MULTISPECIES: hypothetical protein [unclassified Archaeoglobus]|uniref:hypothetical protein n=1 Tax=unclassified Archaeoglobus TaxID=2643606 RepID=UPI0025C638C9|nr:MULTISPECIES: hypothetical protein [unclassified Archaeoglobus]